MAGKTTDTAQPSAITVGERTKTKGSDGQTITTLDITAGDYTLRLQGTSHSAVMDGELYETAKGRWDGRVLSGGCYVGQADAHRGSREVARQALQAELAKVHTWAAMLAEGIEQLAQLPNEHPRPTKHEEAIELATKDYGKALAIALDVNSADRVWAIAGAATDAARQAARLVLGRSASKKAVNDVADIAASRYGASTKVEQGADLDAEPDTVWAVQSKATAAGNQLGDAKVEVRWQRVRYYRAPSEAVARWLARNDNARPGCGAKDDWGRRVQLEVASAVRAYHGKALGWDRQHTLVQVPGGEWATVGTKYTDPEGNAVDANGEPLPDAS